MFVIPSRIHLPSFSVPCVQPVNFDICSDDRAVAMSVGVVSQGASVRVLSNGHRGRLRVWVREQRAVLYVQARQVHSPHYKA